MSAWRLIQWLSQELAVFAMSTVRCEIDCTLTEFFKPHSIMDVPVPETLQKGGGDGSSADESPSNSWDF